MALGVSTRLGARQRALARRNSGSMSGHDEQRHTQFVRLHKIARIYGGKVLSPVYANNATVLEFECGAGHRFVSRPMRIFAGRWCSRCEGHVRRTLHDCAEWARAKNGQCLALVYVHANYPLRWRCAEGHEWMARPNQIRLGGWCPGCLGRGQRTPKELAALARRFNGTCVTTRYDHYQEHLRWRCDQGHEFSRTISDVRRGRWCQRCLGRIPWSLAELQRIAEERGGTCLSRRYVNTQTPMRWRCAEGHTWTTAADHVVRGSWCMECNYVNRSYKRRLTMADMHATAAGFGGECLATRYLGAHVKLRWRCSAGHTWTARPDYVRTGRWCVRCNAAERLSRKVTIPRIPRPTLSSFERLSDRQWQTIAAMVEATRGTPRNSRSDLRRTVDAIHWVLHHGAKWCELPTEHGNKTTCWRWYQRWSGDGTWSRIVSVLALPSTERAAPRRRLLAAPGSARGVAAHSRRVVDGRNLPVAPERRRSEDA